MRANHAVPLSLCAGLLAAAASCSGNEPALLVHLHVDPGSLSQCAVVVATGEDGGHGDTAAHAVSAGGGLNVGVYRGALSNQVTLQAKGFISPACAGRPDEQSESIPAAFVAGSFPERDLTLRGEGSCTDGQDGDGDGLVDCADPACAAAPSCADGGSLPPAGAFPYVPSNFDPDAFPAPDAGLTIDCDAGYDTGTRVGYVCGAPLPRSYLLDGGAAGTVVLMPVGSLTITAAGQWRITGANPLILAVYGDAGIGGALLAGASGATDGPGVRRAACPGTGGDGQDGGNGGGGGGGGGYARPGAAGSPSAGTQAPGGDGGATFGTTELVPLRAGCPGGHGGVQSGGPALSGGGGGGALQLSAAGNVTVSGAIGAPGGGGASDTGTTTNNGGGGGGSGGAILLEGVQLTFAAGGRVTANGGGGAEGCDTPNACSAGEDGRIDGPYPAAGGAGHSVIPGGDGGAGTIDATPGWTYIGSNFGGGGGGGGVGRIRLNAAERCTFLAPQSQALSPPATSNQRGDAGCP